jgi:uncharacterized protein (TIGR00290 family)
MKQVLFTWSTGKDSTRALYELLQTGQYGIAALVTTVTEEYGRVSIHGVREELLDMQAASLGIALEKVKIRREATNDEYEQAFEKLLRGFRKHGLTDVAFGDIFLEDTREYRKKNLARAGMKALFPIWKRDTRELSVENIELGFRAVVTCVDTEQLDGSFAGREIDTSFINDLPEGVDPCGENGEFHSFVYDAPCFSKPVPVTAGETVLRDERFMFTDLTVSA